MKMQTPNVLRQGLPASYLLDMTADEAQWLAYASLSGDPGAPSVGKHGGRSINRMDTGGRTKAEHHDAAVLRDAAYFEKLAEGLVGQDGQLKLSPSLRTYLMKSDGDPSKGYRPIDDCAEDKRLLELRVRSLIEPGVERLLHPRQYGGRFLTNVQTWLPTVDRPRGRPLRPTVLDQMARGVFDTIHGGHGVALCLDLKNAYGLLAKRSGMPMLRGVRVQVDERHLGRGVKELPLGRRAAQVVWRLGRLDAVDARTRRKTYRRCGRGIEQGGQLSSMLMNLALSPVVTAVEQALDVVAFSYLDDIYFMCRDGADAEVAFRAFRHECSQRGFTNVRPLGNTGKASHIVDTRQGMAVRVLKTYDVDHRGISLAPEKVEKLYEEGKLEPGDRVGIKALRRASCCVALTKAASRERTPSVMTKKRKNKNTSVTIKAVTGNKNTLEGSSGLLRQATGTTETSVSNLHCESGSVIQTTAGEGSLVLSQMHGPEGTGPERATTCSSLYPHRDTSRTGTSEGEGLPLGKTDGLDGVPTEMRTPTLPIGGQDERLIGGGVVPPHEAPKGGTEAQGISDGDSPVAEAGDTAKDWTSAAESSVEPPPSVLSIFEPEVLQALRAGTPIRLGDRYKGRVLNLVGLQQVLGDAPAGCYVAVVNALVKAVRTMRVAVVLYDPLEAWTTAPNILGRTARSPYVRRRPEVLRNGTVRATLVQRQRKLRRESWPPLISGVVVLRIQPRGPARHPCCTVRSIVAGVSTVESFPAVAASRRGQALLALAAFVQRHPSTPIWVPPREANRAGTALLHVHRPSPANVPESRATIILRRRAWRREGDWLVAAGDV